MLLQGKHGAQMLLAQSRNSINDISQHASDNKHGAQVLVLDHHNDWPQLGHRLACSLSSVGLGTRS